MIKRAEVIPSIITAFNKEIFLLERRAAGYQAELDEAVRAGTWSHVAGLDGRITGILVSIASIRDSINWLEVELNRTQPEKQVVRRPSARRGERKVVPVGESV